MKKMKSLNNNKNIDYILICNIYLFSNLFFIQIFLYFILNLFILNLIIIIYLFYFNFIRS